MQNDDDDGFKIIINKVWWIIFFRRDIVRQSAGGVRDSGGAVVRFWITNLGVQKCLKFGFICFGLFLAKRVRR